MIRDIVPSRGGGGVVRTPGEDINPKSVKTDCFHKPLQPVQASGIAHLNAVSLRGGSPY